MAVSDSPSQTTAATDEDAKGEQNGGSPAKEDGSKGKNYIQGSFSLLLIVD
jgi:hypothetical protein